MNLVFEKRNEGPGRKVEDPEGLALRAREETAQGRICETGIYGGYFRFFGKEKGRGSLAAGVGEQVKWLPDSILW